MSFKGPLAQADEKQNIANTINTSRSPLPGNFTWNALLEVHWQ